MIDLARLVAVAWVALCGVLGGCAAAPAPSAKPDLAKDVANTERAFARSMAERDFARFTSFLSDEAVFFNGSQVLRGKQQVADAWRPFYERPAPPFSWESAEVAVLDSGTLALSSGPVRDPSGKRVATYTSIWRLEAPGTWRIVFDQGTDTCDCQRAP